MENMEKTTKQTNPFYLTGDWRRKRKEILARDHYECQQCKREGRVTTNDDAVLEVDHIKELKYFPELAMDNDNLQTLCKECHNKKHGRMNFRGGQKSKKWNDEFDVI